MTAKRIHLVETYPGGLKTIKTYLSEINANHSLYTALDDAMSSDVRPDLVILLANKNIVHCNEDITCYHNDPSFSKIPLILMLPPQVTAYAHAIKRDKCQFAFQMPLDNLRFLARVARLLDIPPRRIFKVVVTIMEENGNRRYAGVSVDFSETGMAFECDTDFAVGHKIIVRFINPKNREKFLLNAEIARRSETQHEKKFFYGVRFKEITFSDTVALRNFITGEADE